MLPGGWNRCTETDRRPRIGRCRRFRLLLRRPGGPLFASWERATIGLSGPWSVLAVDTSIPT